MASCTNEEEFDLQLDPPKSLKRSRGGYVARLTRLINDIERQMLSYGNEGQVKSLSEDINKAMVDFEVAHQAYIASLEDGDERNEAISSFETHKNGKLVLDHHVQNWLLFCREYKQKRSSKASVRSTSSTSSAREARRKQRLAQLDFDQLQRRLAEEKRNQDLLMEQQHQTKLRLAQDQLERANLEAKMAEEEEEERSSCSGSLLEFQSNANLDFAKTHETGNCSKGKTNLHKVEPVTKPDNLGTKPGSPGTQNTASHTNVGNANPKQLCPDAKPFYKPWGYGESEQMMPFMVQSLAKMADAMYRTSTVLKRDIDKFSGDPKHYCKFMHAFENTIANNLEGDGTKLEFLIESCDGEAKEAIEDCVLLPDSSEGLFEARSTLKELYGRPQTVAHSYVKNLTKGPSIKPNDGKALTHLALQIRKCELTLRTQGYTSEIHNSETIAKIMRRLPYAIQHKWIAKAYEIQERGREPTFSDFSSFVTICARMANTYYGQSLAADNSPSSKYNNRQAGSRPQRATTMATNSNSEGPVPFCEFCRINNHSIAECTKFSELSVKERRSFVYDNTMCFTCLIKGHASRGCFVRIPCGVGDCTSTHHKLLHVKYTRPRAEVSSSNISCSTTRTASKICLRVVPIRVQYKGKLLTTHALLDSGSDVSLCSQRLTRILGIIGPKTNFSINTVGERGTRFDSIETSLTVFSHDKKGSILIPRVLGVEKIPVSPHNIPTAIDIRQYDHLRDVTFPYIGSQDVDLIIGTNSPEAFWVIDQRKGGTGEPYAIKTVLGWSLVGPMGSVRNKESNVNFVSKDELLTKQVEQFWKADFGDLHCAEVAEMSRNDKKALEFVERSIVKVEGHYQVGFPWKCSPSGLRGNLHVAKSRLNSLKRRLKSSPELHQRYTEVINKYIADGHARVVPHDEVIAKSNELWYLPHHPVINPLKPSKLRIVFDCAAEYKGMSLNKFLYSGPDYTSSLLGVLLRFRKGNVALMGDVEGMFHQLKLDPGDWGKLSFLWWPQGNLDSDPDTCQMVVHLFGANSSPFCANYALKRCVTDYGSEYNSDVCKTVLESFYVDDCLVSFDTVDEVKQVYFQLTKLLQRGGFKITKWLSNSLDIAKFIPEQDRAASLKKVDMSLSQLPVDRALGVKWNTSSDRLGFSVNLKDQPRTRRGILSTLSSVYDPLGAAAPFCLSAKILLQDLCRRKLGWDQPIPGDVDKVWSMWLGKFPLLNDVTFARCIKPSNFGVIKSVQIHHFSDASTKGYGAVSYVRLINAEGKIHVSFLMGKSHLTPIKTITIPRLELNAAVVSVRLHGILLRELGLDIDKTFFWSDSTTVIKYIRNETRRFQTFVANRLSKISAVSSQNQWYHIDGDLNPADDASRGLHPNQYTSKCRWLTGPKFLYDEESDWKTVCPGFSLDDDDPELRREPNVLVTHERSKHVLMQLVERFSNWNRMLKAFCWLNRFKTFIVFRSKKQPMKFNESIDGHEMLCSELDIIRLTQQEFLPKLYGILQTRKPLCERVVGKGVMKLRPFIDECGILRVGGRLARAPISYESRHQILLPRCHLSNLVIQHYHRKYGHVGSPHTWSVIRQRYWILGGGTEVRKTIGKCIHCCKRNAKLGVQVMADLPKNRVTPDKAPFSSIGVDYFGPLTVRRGRSNVKRFGCLFTCMASRAIHLELAYDLSSSSFINCFRRFVCRRGLPEVIFSDNGKNFVGGERELREEFQKMDTGRIGSYMASNKIIWKFNPPLASHMGGIWERLVRSTKSILKSLLLNQLVTDDVLSTLLIEVEFILNSRPLTPLTIDNASGEALTPNDLLLFKPACNLPPGMFSEKDNFSKRRWRQIQYMTDQFWRRWKSEYLPLLQTRSKWLEVKANLKVGDLVLVADDSCERGRWPLGKVLHVHGDKQGNVRSVEILCKGGTFTRPITKLCGIKSLNDENLSK